MSTVFEFSGVRQFTAELEQRLVDCDNGEGRTCHDLDGTIRKCVDFCDELREVIREWSKSIFHGRTSFDPAEEALVKTQLARLLAYVKHVAARGRSMTQACYMFEALNDLHYRMAELQYLQDNWVSPRLSVSPAPRVKLPPEVIAEGKETLRIMRQESQPSTK